MKIRSAVPENGCLIFTHYLVANGKRRQKTDCKTYMHSHHLAAQVVEMLHNKDILSCCMQNGRINHAVHMTGNLH